MPGWTAYPRFASGSRKSSARPVADGRSGGADRDRYLGGRVSREVDRSSSRQADHPASFNQIGVDPAEAAGIVDRLGFARHMRP